MDGGSSRERDGGSKPSMLMRWQRRWNGPRFQPLPKARAPQLPSAPTPEPAPRAGDEQPAEQAFVGDGLPIVLKREVERARRDGRSLALLVLELDDFERFTATRGRPASDRVLRRTAELVRARAREIDIVMVHGDELACILPGLAPDGLTSFSMAVHEAIVPQRFEPDDHRFTVSLGAARLGPDFTNANELLHAAEARLGLAKSLLGSERESLRRSLAQSHIVGPNTALAHGWCYAGQDSLRLRRGARLVGARLLVIHGKEIGREYHLEWREMTIGRASTSDIHIDDGSVSRTHATITGDDRGIELCDKGSKHGTRVNGVPIREARLLDGDLVVMGAHVFKVLLLDDVERALHPKGIHRLPIVDGLTQIFNKRYFSDALERELSRARRYDRPLALMMFDIDHFERCNDTFGHRAGDHVLQQLAELVRDRSRKVDVVARYGGEEFAVILPEIDLQVAAKLGETIREIVEQTRFVFEGRHIPLTVSVAVAELEPHIANADDLVRITEARMARAKALGRNRVVSSDEQAEAAENEPPDSPPALA